LSRRTAEHDQEETIYNTQDTEFQEKQPYQKRRCGETGLYQAEEQKQREEVRKIIYARQERALMKKKNLEIFKGKSRPQTR
jgi:hypothetical protein